MHQSDPRLQASEVSGTLQVYVNPPLTLDIFNIVKGIIIKVKNSCIFPTLLSVSMKVSDYDMKRSNFICHHFWYRLILLTWSYVKENVSPSPKLCLVHISQKKNHV